jgi:hypothetical protein
MELGRKLLHKKNINGKIQNDDKKREILLWKMIIAKTYICLETSAIVE